MVEATPDGAGKDARVEPVRVFISYAHDDAEHEDREFWLFLRRHGIDARLDKPAAERRQDWLLWTDWELRQARYVLVVASPAYRQRTAGDAGQGVQWEARPIQDEVYADDEAAPDPILPGGAAADVPSWLSSNSSHYAVAEYTVAGAERLLRLLTGQPTETESPPGPRPDLPPRGASRAGLRTELLINATGRGAELVVDVTLAGTPLCHRESTVPDLGPLALQAGVTVIRRVVGAPQIIPTPQPGPPKILAAVAVPDEWRTDSPPLDTEAERQAVLDAVPDRYATTLTVSLYRELVTEPGTPAARDQWGATTGGQLVGVGGIGKTAVAKRVQTRLRTDGWATAVYEGRWNPNGIADLQLCSIFPFLTTTPHWASAMGSPPLPSKSLRCYPAPWPSPPTSPKFAPSFHPPNALGPWWVSWKCNPSLPLGTFSQPSITHREI